MSTKTPVKSAFAPMKAKITGLPAASPPVTRPTTEATKQKSPRKDQTPSDEIIVLVDLCLEIVNRPEKLAPFWGYLGDPRTADFGKRCVACLNAAHRPASAALERKDWRALKWFVSLAICERVSLETHALVESVRFRLGQLALARPSVDRWESILWAAYSLKDRELLAGLESVPLEVGTRQKFAPLSVRVSASKLAQWRGRMQAKRNRKTQEQLIDAPPTLLHDDAQ